MQPVPQIISISDMHNRAAAILNLLNDRPVYLAQRSRPVAVLVSVDHWDAIAHKLRDLRAFKAAHTSKSHSDG